MSCNGWKNYQTWAYASHLDNDEQSNNAVRWMAREVIEEADDTELVAITLADRLKDEAEESKPELGNSVWEDLLSSAIEEIDWHEIAENILSEVSE